MRIILTRNGRAIAALHCSYIAAKTFSKELSQAISHIENALGTSIPTVEETNAKLEAGLNKKGGT